MSTSTTTTTTDVARQLDVLTDLVTPWAMRVAATLTLADRIGDSAVTVDDLARHSGAVPDTVGRLLEHLAARGVFAPDGPHRYRNTELSHRLRRDHPMTLHPWLDIEGGMGQYDIGLSALLLAVRTGADAYTPTFGRSFFDDLNTDAERAAAYDDLMASLTAWTLPEILQAYDWQTVAHVTDVAGGSGALLAGLLRAHPHLHGTLVDHARAARTASARFAEEGLADRATALAGSMFDPLPPGADLYLVKSTVMGWGDGSGAADILRRCARAAGPGGRVVVAEFLRGAPRLVPSLDLYMALLGGKERTEEEFRALGAAAGLTLRDVRPTPSGYCLLEFTPDA
ncbi:methyltransferase [Streptomyces sp. NPDC087440]|uniref:methyltransferase n=1 Tax=Streptomyces sp. NPDC087440 TaxID=3365790 RepID=UPI0037FCD57D